MNLIAEVNKLQTWMFESSLPLWADHGLHESGAAFEALDFAGSPLPVDDSRVRVQARQLYSFSLAHAQGWRPEQSRQIVAGLLKVISSACCRPDGLYGRRITLPCQALIDDTADLYDNAFVLLALAGARTVLGSAELEQPLGKLLAALQKLMARGGGQGYAEVLPAPHVRQQNPHMHLFESLLALYSVTGDANVRTRLTALVEFIERTFFSEDDACVFEYANSDDASHTAFFEPGHSMEWVWLLGWHARLLKLPYPPFGHALYERALQTLDSEGRAVMSVVSSSGAPLDESRRLWSQTETLKAHLCIVEQTDGDVSQRAAACAARCARDVYKEWLAPAIAGGWQDHFSADGRSLAGNMPASSGYHVYCAIAEAVRVSSGSGAGTWPG